MTIGQKLATTAAKALEAFAQEEFSREKIFAACHAAAAEGQPGCQIRPSRPVDVSVTLHMKGLLAELQRERLHTSWVSVSLPKEPAFKILEVRWEIRDARSSAQARP